MAGILFFAADLAETAQLRRIRSFARAGYGVSSVSMRKPGALQTVAADWPDLDLGTIANARLGRRIGLALTSLGKLWRHRRMIGQSDLIVARNIDMVLLALLARRMARRRVPVIYECLDIHRLFIGTGVKARLARWVERWVLKRVALLVVSSPGFMTHYFEPTQAYSGSWALLENKLWFDGPALPRPRAVTQRSGPLVLAWVGSIRCQASLDLLCAVAAGMGDRLRIEIRGVIHDHALRDFHRQIAAHPNIRYGGPYAYPAGLAEVYAAGDLVWAQDLWQAGSNSDWLLPNRIYEASWFGCPSIAVACTQTAARIAADGLGFIIDRADPASLQSLLDRLDRPTIAAVAGRILQLSDAGLMVQPAELHAIFYRAVGHAEPTAGELVTVQ